jgi:hypothetical protein
MHTGGAEIEEAEMSTYWLETAWCAPRTGARTSTLTNSRSSSVTTRMDSVSWPHYNGRRYAPADEPPFPSIYTESVPPATMGIFIYGLQATYYTTGRGRAAAPHNSDASLLRAVNAPGPAQEGRRHAAHSVGHRLPRRAELERVRHLHGLHERRRA